MQGDIEGVFYFLQTEPDFQSLGELMVSALSPAAKAAQIETSDYMVPDWLQQQRNKDRRGIKKQILDATSELGNMLFGGYLTALYSGCNLTVYYDPPTTRLDEQHLLLEKALQQNAADCNTAFVIQIEYVIANKKLGSWLLMLPNTSGLRAMLDSMDSDHS